MPQQKFAQPLTRSLPVLFGIFPRSYQIPQCLMRRIGNPDRGQIAIPVTPRQLRGIAPIGFYAITGFGWDQRRRNHVTAHTQLCQLPVQNIPGRAGFVAGFQLLRKRVLYAF